MNFVKKMFGKIRDARRNKGVTMLEMLLVLSIISVLLVLATRYYMSTSYAQKTGQLQMVINSIQAATANYKSSDPSLEGLKTDGINVLYKSGFLSGGDLDSTRKNALTPWGTAITITGTGGMATIGFTAADGSPESAACLTLANNLNSNSSLSGISASCEKGKFTYTFSP